MKRHFFFSALLILLITYSFSSGAQQSAKTNRKKIEQQNLEKWALINEHVLYTDPDSAIVFYKGLIPDFYYSGCLWANLALAYHLQMENDQACLHYYLADEYGHELTKNAVNEMNCQSWQNEWIGLIAQYEKDSDDYGLEEVQILNLKKRRPTFLFMLKVNDWCWLSHKGQNMEVKFLFMKDYVFGPGLHFITRDGLHVFKVYRSDFFQTIKHLEDNDKMVRK